MQNRIHLGLDLKGGTHLVLQVHVAEAVNSTTDRDVQRLNDGAGGRRRDGGQARPGASGDDHRDAACTPTQQSDSSRRAERQRVREL